MSRACCTEEGASRLTVRHVAVVVTSILVCFGPATLVFNTWSILVVPVCEGLNLSTSSFTFYISLVFLFSALAAPFAGNLMERFDVRIVITAACGMAAAGIFLCSFYTEVWQFYVSGALEGAGVVVLVSLVAPTLINRWFSSHMGLLIGICVAMMGVGAAVWNMLGGVLLNEFDWRMCYRTFGVIAAVISMPATALLIRSYPEDVGLRPYGAPPVERGGEASSEGADAAVLQKEGVPAARAFRMPAFALLAITIGLINGTAQVGNYLAKYVNHLFEVGSLAVGAAEVVLMASAVAACLQVAQACAKIVLGQVADHSLRVALAVVCVCGFAGVLLCWQGSALEPAAVYPGAVLVGVLYGATNVLGPTITRYLFGPRDYTVIYSRVAVVVNLMPVAFVPLYAALADVSWNALFGFAAAVVLAISVCSFVLMRQAKRIA